MIRAVGSGVIMRVVGLGLAWLLAIGCGGEEGDNRGGDDIDVSNGDDDDDDVTPDDADGDGFGLDEDCDDTNPAINPLATDIVGDGIDQNCDGVDGTDQDGDGFASETSGGDDCDDASTEVYVGAPDTVGDDIDQNCDGIDGQDGDGDGFASEGSGGDDCDDSDPNINPGSADVVGDGVDDNCDLLDGIDADGDGHADRPSGGDDCDDGDAAINPTAVEIFYDGVDQDCDGACDYDADGDQYLLVGHVPVDGDACDFDPAVGQVWTEEDCDDNDVNVGMNGLVNQVPSDGENQVYYRTSVDGTLQAEDLAAVLTVSDAGGGAVSGVQTIDDRYVTFVPDNPLSPSAAYDVDFSWACGQAAWSFTTSDVGTPTDTGAVLGSTYSVDLASARWVEPAGVGALLQQYFDSALLLEFNQLAPTLDVLMSLSALPGQDLCELTVDQPPGDFSQDPYFSVGPATVAFDMQGIDIAWEGMNLTGTFSPDGSTLEGVTLIATQDTRPLVQLIGGYGDDAVCDLVLAFGVSCVACPSDGQPYCLTTRVDNMIGQLEPGIDLVPITPSDVDNNPSCN